MSVDTSKTWLGFPEPENTASIKRVPASVVAEMIQSSTSSESNFQLIDVRRADLTGTMLRTSVNLPAHTFYPSRASIAHMLSGRESVILFCGSSQGRGPRCAGWLRDALAGLDSRTEVLIMDGGIKGFVKAYGGEETLLLKLPEEVKES